MRTAKILFGFAIIAAVSVTVAFGQDAPSVSTPAVADNASPVDNNIKMRSVELERIKRDAEKTAVIRRENGKELNFSLIKEDFEGIQKEQSEIIQAYTTGKTIDYAAISQHADKITEMAVRLRGNVFRPEGDDSTAVMDSEEKNPYTGKSVRDLIVELDNSIGEVVTSPMWQKLAVIDPDVSEKVEASLVKVIQASGALWVESGKAAKK